MVMRVEELNIKDLIYTFLKGYKIILTSILILIILAYAYTIVSYEEIYRARASMVINSKQIRVLAGEIVSVNDIMISQNMVNTYKEILLSDNVLEKVNDDLGTKILPSDMRKWIAVSSPGDTEVIYVYVEHEDPKIAASIANSMMKVAPDVIAKTLEVGSINVLDYAKTPTTPLPANIELNLAIGAVLGLVLGIGILLLYNFLMPKIKNSKDIENMLELNVLGEIIHSYKTKTERPVITQKHIEGFFVESFKVAALNVLNACSKTDCRKLLITSTREKEGKTTTAINLGIAMALNGKSVLLLDCDLYKYNFIKSTDIEKKCLIDVLKGYCDYKDALIVDEESGMHILPSKGGNKGNIDLINSVQMERLVKTLEEEYDYILIDTPPSFVISDAIYLSRLADGVLFVVKQEYELVENIISIRNALLNLGINIIGCMLSDIKYVKAEKKYAYKYKYDYSTYYYEKF